MKHHLPAHPAAVLALAFLGVIAVGTGLLMLPWATASGEGAPWLTALFTATSAVCVTGLVVVDTGTYWSPLGQAMVMGLFQLGGFGMMTSVTLMGLLIGGNLKLRTRLLLQAETHALSMGDVRSVARVVLLVTLVCEGAVAHAALRAARRHGVGRGAVAGRVSRHLGLQQRGLFHLVGQRDALRGRPLGAGAADACDRGGRSGLSSAQRVAGAAAVRAGALVDPRHAHAVGLAGADHGGLGGDLAGGAQQPAHAGQPGLGAPGAGGAVHLGLGAHGGF